MSIFKKIEQHKLFRPILTAVLCIIPLLGLIAFNEHLAQIQPYGVEYLCLWPFALLTLVELAGLLWLGRVIGFKKMIGGVSWVLIICFPMILYFCVEWLCFGKLYTTLKFFFGNHFYMSLFVGALLTSIYWIFNVIWRRFWISSTLMSVVMMILAYINIAKIGINGDPLLPTDFAFASKLGDLAGFAQGALPFPVQLIYTVLLLIAVNLIIFFGGKKCTKCLWLRPTIAVLCAAFVTFTVIFPKVKDYIFLADNIEMSRQYRQTVVYSNHGFLGGFVINIEGYVAPPEGYDKEYITSLIKSYETNASDGSDFQSPDVIVYLGESVFDITKLDTVEFTEDPLKVLHMLEDKYLSGTMLQASGVGGGTVRSEFEVLTGINLVDMKEGLIPYNTFVPKSQERVYGLPNYFKELGYTTIGIHSYDRTFYSRDECYGRMGFDTFIGEQDMVPNKETMSEQELSKIFDLTSKRQFMYDDYFVGLIEQQLEKDPEKDKFLFAISMENHGQFTNKYQEYDQVASCDNWDEKENSIANCYVKSVKAADEALGRLYEYVMNREKPTVVLWFGDHLPTLNERHTVLEKAGYISTGWSDRWGKEEYYNMYRTPFVMFSNYLEAPKSEIGDHSSYMIAPVLLDYINAPTNGYWELITAMHEQVKTYNRMITIDADGIVNATSVTDEYGTVVGSYLDELPEEAAELVEAHTLLSYDALAGKRYINDLLMEEK